LGVALVCVAVSAIYNLTLKPNKNYLTASHQGSKLTSEEQATTENLEHM